VTGPEHYREAERLLVSCQILRGDRQAGDAEQYPAAVEDEGGDTCRNALMAARVHATLALAAAAIECASFPLGWSEVLS
jgi:hypothetical protein